MIFLIKNFVVLLVAMNGTVLLVVVSGLLRVYQMLKRWLQTIGRDYCLGLLLLRMKFLIVVTVLF